MKIEKITNTILLFIMLTFCATSIFAQVVEANLNLMPYPEEVKISDGQFKLNKEFTIQLNTEDEKVYKAAQRTIDIIARRTGLFFKERSPIPAENAGKGSVFIDTKGTVQLEFKIDESYSLDISQKSVVIEAENCFGAMHALSTLVQLIDSDEDGYYFPCLTINDKPRFPWRGLLIDVSRHFEPVDVIKRNLDAMAAVKLNVMHWHLTDDQGFRIESKVYPKLHELGSDGLYYTQTEIKDIVKYAEERGIRVMPEFDLPGHATSWFIGYPHLASAPGPYTIERLWGIFDPTFDPANEDVYIFLKAFFEEMSELFPDEYWHIGGDENNGHQWDANPEIQAFMKENDLKDNHALQNYFNERLDKILSKLDKTMVGWYTDEMPDLSKDYIVQAWKGRKTLYETAKNGYRSLLSHGFYIDLVQSTEYHYLNDPIPPDSILTDEVKERIIGGEATMWAEFVGPETIDSRIWPRTAAIAERLWSPGKINDVKNMYERLDKMTIQLEDFGLTHIKNIDMMLRRIVGDYDVATLKNFVNAIEPLYTYSRDRPHIFLSHYPLSRIVDIAQPDPRLPREFSNLVDSYLKNGSHEKAGKIKELLELWHGNHKKLAGLIKVKPILKEIETLSADLSKCAAVGMKALEYYVQEKKADETWVKESNEILDAAKKPRGETELSIIEPIRKLVAAVQ